MTDFKSYLLKLNTNLNTLREREAKHTGNAPLDLSTKSAIIKKPSPSLTKPVMPALLVH